MEKDNKEKNVAEAEVEQTPINTENAEGSAEMVKEEKPNSAKEMFFANIKGKHPELGDDEEAIFGYANDSYSKKRDIAEKGKKIFDLINGNEDIANLLVNSSKYPHDASFALKSLPKEVLEDALAKYDEPVDDEAMAKSLKEWRSKKAEEKATQERINGNLEANDKTIADFAKENGMSEEDVVSSLMPVIESIKDGKITPELLSMIRYSSSRDKDLEDKYNEGLLQGKNEQIEASKLQNEPQTDGLPTTGSGIAPKEPEDKTKGTMWENVGKKSAWERMLSK